MIFHYFDLKKYQIGDERVMGYYNFKTLTFQQLISINLTETKLDPSAALNQETFPPENTKLLMKVYISFLLNLSLEFKFNVPISYLKDVQSRLNIMESTINQLKKENSHQDEEIHQMKNQSKNQEQTFLEMTRTLMDRIKILIQVIYLEV